MSNILRQHEATIRIFSDKNIVSSNGVVNSRKGRYIAQEPTKVEHFLHPPQTMFLECLFVIFRSCEKVNTEGYYRLSGMQSCCTWRPTTPPPIMRGLRTELQLTRLGKFYNDNYCRYLICCLSLDQTKPSGEKKEIFVHENTQAWVFCSLALPI